MLPDTEWTPIKEIPDPVSGPEPPPTWAPITSWGNPRVWLRETVKAFSAWLNKPTKAERENLDAWNEAARDWSIRSCGGACSSDSTPPPPSEARCTEAPADRSRTDSFDR